MGKKTVLIVDDERDVLSVLARFCRDLGHATVAVGSCAETRQALRDGPVDLLLLDVVLPDGEGVDLFRELSRARPDLPVIFMTGQGRVEVAVEAMRLGARDFLLKPFDMDGLARSIDACLQSARPASGPVVPGLRQVVGESAALREVWRQVDLFAPTDITVLLLGDSGTGKELFARAIHAKSKRAKGPFIEMDCASIPSSLIEAELFGYEKGAFTDAKENRPGKFELASGGTLFLDELGNLSLEAQAKLLRLVQERRFRRIGGSALITADVRIVGATNLDLSEAVRRGAFRGDLFYRLGEMPIRLPALRDREGDLPPLVASYISEFNACYNKSVTGVTPEAMRVLSAFDWPGNVRELANVIRVGVLQCERVIDLGQLPTYIVRAVESAGGAELPPPAAAPAEAPPRARADAFEVEIPWGDDERGLDLKQLTHDVKSKLEARVLHRLAVERRMNKAQMARYLKVDYKVLTEKLRSHGLG